MRRSLTKGIISLCLVLACGCHHEPDTNESPVSCTGLWLKSIDSMEALVPTGDGKTAWAWNRDELIVVDARGNQVRKVELPDKWRFRSWTRSPVRPCEDGTHAWMTSEDGRIGYVSTAGNVSEPGSVPPSATIGSQYDITTDHLWIQSDFPERGRLYHFTADGKKEFFGDPEELAKGGLSGRADQRMSKNGQWFWSYFDGVEYGPGAGGNPKRNVSVLLLAEAGRKDARDLVKELQGKISLKSVVFAEDGDSCWVPGKDGGVFGIGGDGIVKNEGKPYWPTVLFGELRRAAGDNLLWCHASEGLYALNLNGKPANDGKPLFAGKVLESVHPSAGRRALVVTKGGDVYLAKSEGEPKRLEKQDSLRKARVKAVMAASEAHWWVEARDGKVYVIAAGGTVANGGNAAPGVSPAQQRSGFADDDRDEVEHLGLLQTIALVDDDRAFVVSADALSLINNEAKVMPIDLPHTRGASIRGLRLSDDKKYCWVSQGGAITAVVRTADGKAFPAGREPLPGVHPGAYYFAGDGKHAWTSSGSGEGPYVMGLVESADDLRCAGLTFRAREGSRADTDLSLKSKGAIRLRTDPGDSHWALALDWDGRDAQRDIGSAVDVAVYELKDKERQARAAHTEGTPGNDGKASLAPIWDKPWQWNTPYEVALKYKDDFGSRLEVTWREVHFDVPFWQLRWLRTTVAALLIVLLTVGLLRWGVVGPGLRGWLPAALWLSSGGLAKLDGVQSALAIDGSLLGWLLLGAVAAAVPLGLVAPVVFRDLARAEPFSRLAPYALTFPWLRRRIFASYLKEVRDRLGDRRAGARHEVYMPLPAVAERPAGQTGPLTHPAETISGWLAARLPRDRPHVLVESAGGRGKSALLREVMERLLGAVDRDPFCPIPVVGDGKGDDLAKMVSRALGDHLIAPDALDYYLRQGYFLVVIDGLTEVRETPLGADALRDFVRSDAGAATKLLITIRPNEAYREAVKAGGPWVVVEPKRLDRTTIGGFVSHYVKEDAKRTKSPPFAPAAELLSACKGVDEATGEETYLQVLVRLAVGASAARTIEELYSETFKQLLGSSAAANQILDQASTFCAETYWLDGSRDVPFRIAKAVHKVLLQQLLDAGIVVSADKGASAPGREPQLVHFFHDSMQSYLTARGLYALYGAAADWPVLREAAGDARFVKAQSDLFSGEGSELFQMCLYVFVPPDKLARILASHLRRWAVEHDGHLRKTELVLAVPAPLRPGLVCGAADSPGTVLARAVELCLGDATGRSLAILYARLAPLVWPYRGPAQPPAPAPPPAAPAAA